MSTRLAGIGMTSQRTRTRMVERLREQGIKNESMLAVMNEVPRHIFIEEALQSRAYEDTALPIGNDQTISQPYIVARMTELLYGARPLDKVLEVGTGCGYQTAVLARLVREVCTIERLAPLMRVARTNLRELGIRNVRFRHGDGYQGMPDAAPFDAIIVTAAATHMPEALQQQLAVGGRMVVPVGTQEQYLHVIERHARGFTTTKLDAVKFVPMLSGVRV